MFFQRARSKEPSPVREDCFQDKMNAAIEANAPLMGYVFLMLEPDDWLNCERVCRSWRKFMKEYFYREESHRQAIEEKVTAWAWSRKDPKDREFTLPKEFRDYSTNIVLLNRDEMLLHTKHKFFTVDRRKLKIIKVRKFSFKHPKGEKVPVDMKLRVVGEIIVALIQFRTSNQLQLCTWNRKSGSRIQFMDEVAVKDSHMDLFISEDKQYVIVDVYYAAVVLKLDPKGNFTKFYKIQNKKIIFHVAGDMIVARDSETSYSLHDYKTPSVVREIQGIKMEYVIFVKKKGNTLLFAGFHDPLAKERYFFYVYNLSTGKSDKSDCSKAYFNDISGTDMIKTSDEILFVPHETGWDMTNLFMGDMREIRDPLDVGAILDTIFINKSMAILIRNSSFNDNGHGNSHGHGHKTIVNLEKFPDEPLKISEIVHHYFTVEVDMRAFVMVLFNYETMIYQDYAGYFRRFGL